MDKYTQENILKYDRDAVNHETQANPRPCLLVSDEFFEEMLGCVPPQFFGTTNPTGCYSIMQVGEAMDFKDGKLIYETFQRMNQSAIDQSLADSRMILNRWYFVGLQTDMNDRIKTSYN